LLNIFHFQKSSSQKWIILYSNSANAREQINKEKKQ